MVGRDYFIFLLMMEGLNYFCVDCPPTSVLGYSSPKDTFTRFITLNQIDHYVKYRPLYLYRLSDDRHTHMHGVTL